jgi:multiple sugar transport system substrate-binding protein
MISRLVTTVVVFAAAATAHAGQVRYMLWDSIQLPAYRQCATDFMAKHPGTTIKITQAGWTDYWTAVSAGFIAGLAPDVFTNHLGKHPEFVANELLVDLAPYIRRDKVDLGLYPKPLVEVWGRDGKQYGLPKDWDTVSLMVNLAHAEKSGVTLAELQQMAWNPKDGGSFEQVIKRLTIDKNGRNALSPQFDAKSIAVYGYQTGSAGGMAGQVEWSHLAASNGFAFQDKPWSVPYRYDDPRLAQTIDWLAGLPAKGLSAPYQNAFGMGAAAMFAAGRAAMIPEGSWMITYVAGNAKFRNTWVPLPVGPIGKRATMINGLSDAMWIGSKVKEEAWQWIKYLASPECQRVVAARGVTFPAITGMAESVVELHRKNGIDAAAFLTMSREHTFLMPIAENGARVEAVMKSSLESVLLGKQAATPALSEANRTVNRLFRGGNEGAR